VLRWVAAFGHGRCGTFKPIGIIPPPAAVTCHARGTGAGRAAPTAIPPPNISTQNNGKGLAKRTFKDRLTLGSGSEQVDLPSFGRAHTNGDAMVDETR
jgi:hypothetical protein